MDRERRLLYIVAILAPLVEVFTLATWHWESDFPSRAALITEANNCEQHLFRAWAECAPRHSHHEL